ncbi:MAG: hypothetical protein H6757_01805 [Candidatus Omnitrophica bacterium]|nr:hypothetical protein [Candidatus Omnitrophota bacterium]
MKIRKSLSFLMLLGVIGLFFSLPMRAEDDVLYSYGRVVSVSADQIVVAEYDYDADAEVNITYLIDPSVELTGVEKPDDLKADDEIEFDFVSMAKGSRIISISREE